MKSVNNGSGLILRISYDEAHLLGDGLRELIKNNDESASILLDELYNKNVVDIDAEYQHERW